MRKLTLLLGALLLSQPALAREAVDSVGQNLTLPDRPLRVFATIPPLTAFALVVAPEAVVALNRPPSAAERPYLPEAVPALPVAGGWFGNGGGPNLEALVTLAPDLVLTEAEGPTADDAVERLTPLGIKVARLRWENLTETPALFRLLGTLLGRPERGEALARQSERMLAMLPSVPAASQPLVYFAQSADGLRSACGESVHLEVVRWAGGRPAVACPEGAASRKGQRNLSLEQVIALAPDVIVSPDPGFAETIRTDERWHQVKAVAEGRVYIAPDEPYGWLDRPPLFTRLIGALWLRQKLFGGDEAAFAQERETFYRLFFNSPGPKLK